jgi:hypothetical protein
MSYFTVANGSGYKIIVTTANRPDDFVKQPNIGRHEPTNTDNSESSSKTQLARSTTGYHISTKPVYNGQFVELIGKWVQIADCHDEVFYQGETQSNRSLIVSYVQQENETYSTRYYNLQLNAASGEIWIGQDGKNHCIDPMQGSLCKVTKRLPASQQFYVANGSRVNVCVKVMDLSSAESGMDATKLSVAPGRITRLNGTCVAVINEDQQANIYYGPTTTLKGRAIIVTEGLGSQLSAVLNLSNKVDGNAWISEIDGTNHCPKFYVANANGPRQICINVSLSPQPEEQENHRGGEVVSRNDYREFQGSHVEIFARDGKRLYSSPVKAWTSLIVEDQTHFHWSNPLPTVDSDNVWKADGKSYKPKLISFAWWGL